MTGLQKILKTHGEIKAGDVLWVWDYANNCPKKRTDMTDQEYKDNKKHHKEKGFISPLKLDKVEYGKKS